MTEGALKKIVLLLAALAAIASCSKKPSDEDLIRAAIASAVLSAEVKDVRAFMRNVSRSYRDDSGNDYNAIKAMLFSRLFVSEKNRFFSLRRDNRCQGPCCRSGR